MDRSVVSTSLILAYSTKAGKLGEFGLGLKTACLSLGGYFKVMTSSKGDKYTYEVCFDKKEWERSTKGWKVPLRKKTAKEDDHFTVIVINKLKVFYPNLHNYIRDDLQRRYSPFIRKDELQITVNDKLCKPEEIALIEESKKEIEITLKNGNKINGWYALLREGSQRGLYGFHTYRRGRMITTYDKIGFDPHPTLARIIGEISMDHVPVTHNKREFIKESPEYKEVDEVLRGELKELIKLARRRSTQDAVTDQIKRDVDIWKDKISNSLSSEEFRNYTSRIKNVEPVADSSGTLVATVNVEKRAAKENETKNESVPKNEGDRTPKSTHERKRHIFRVKGKNIEFQHTFSSLGESQPWKTYNLSHDKGLEIFTNTDFPAFSVTSDKVFYAVIHIVEALAEVFVQIAQEDAVNIEELKELILRKASKLKAQIIY